MTASEFIKTRPVNGYGNLLNQEKDLIEFAKYHVEKALISASKNADMDEDYYASLQEGTIGFIDKESILNAYPTTLIK